VNKQPLDLPTVALLGALIIALAALFAMLLTVVYVARDDEDAVRRAEVGGE
jgi:hypothetical protein